MLFVHFPNDTIVQNFRHLFFHVSENLEQSVSHSLTASHYSLIESSKSFKESLNRVWRWSGCCRGSSWIEEVLRANGRSLDCRTKLTMDTMEKDKAKNRRIDKNMKNHEKKKGRSIRSVVCSTPRVNDKLEWVATAVTTPTLAHSCWCRCRSRCWCWDWNLHACIAVSVRCGHHFPSGLLLCAL